MYNYVHAAFTYYSIIEWYSHNTVYRIPYTEHTYRIISLCITSVCARLVPWYRPTCSRSSPVCGPWLSCVCQQRLGKLKEQDTCYSKLRYIHVGIHVMKICSTLHVMMLNTCNHTWLYCHSSGCKWIYIYVYMFNID